MCGRREFDLTFDLIVGVYIEFQLILVLYFCWLVYEIGGKFAKVHIGGARRGRWDGVTSHCSADIRGGAMVIFEWGEIAVTDCMMVRGCGGCH